MTKKPCVVQKKMYKQTKERTNDKTNTQADRQTDKREDRLKLHDERMEEQTRKSIPLSENNMVN